MEPETNAPLISVIVASYNAGETSKRCIGSFAAQKYSHKELIWMDGESTDKTVDILTERQSKVTRWTSEKDRGIYHAWNKAIRQSKGEWLCFLGADDYFWSSQALSNIAPYLETANPPYRVVYGQVAVVTWYGEILEMVGRPWEESKDLFLHELTIPHQGVFHHRSLFEKYGLFDESYRITGDYELLLRELKNNDALFVPNQIITGMQFGGLSSSLKNTFININELKRARKQNGFNSFSLPLFWRDIRAKTRRTFRPVLGEKLTNIIADGYRVIAGKPMIWTKKR